MGIKASCGGLTGRPSSLMLLVPIRMRIMRKFTLKRFGGLALLDPVHDSLQEVEAIERGARLAMTHAGDEIRPT